MKKQLLLYVVLLLFFSRWLAGCGGDSSTNVLPPPSPSAGIPVLFVSGGAIDDSIAYLLLTTMDNIDFRGVIITNTDCIDSYAMQTQWKIQSFIGSPSLPVTLSDSRGWNPFPWFYRNDCIDQYNLDILSKYGDNAAWPPYPSGESLLRECLSGAIETKRPLTIVNTCPITMLRNVLEESPYLEKGIERIIMMGGAIDVPGNLDPNTIPPQIANPNAEWNLFCDPYAFNWILKQAKETVTERYYSLYPQFQRQIQRLPYLSFRKMKTRWGSAHIKKNAVTLNSMLVMAPVACIDYVVVHEFAHFIHANHSKAFYGKVEEHIPDWKQRQTLLNKQYSLDL